MNGYAVLKRTIDITGAALLLLLSAPLLLPAMLAVLLDSGRPVIHRRRVVGRGGCEFDAYKLRTMVVDADRLLAEDEALRQHALASSKPQADPRITGTGRWLRRCSLDELPQLVNVLRGQMSLVGPRMITPEELPAWGTTAPLLLRVRPGITGLWQVSGRQRLSRSERIRLDGEYVRGMSLLLDVRILLRTIPAVIGGRGAM